MVNGVGGSSSGYSYRDWLTDQMNGEESEKTEGTESSGKTQTWNAVFTDKKSNDISANDFLTLMVAQLKNQDFMNPVDDTQYVTQLAQFTTMQQMQDMANYMKSNYVMTLVGKNVTAAKFSVSGDLLKETGAVEKISLVDNEYSVYVNGKKFTLEQVMEIHGSASASGSGNTSGEVKEDPAKSKYLLSLIGKEVTVRERNDKGEPAGKLTGPVGRISTEGGKYQLQIAGEWYSLDDVLEVGESAGSSKEEEAAAL